ncbi:MAG: hypothetical protein GY947_20630 [Rhodobacteraceae bacterium]|nr:hypothetical protein [Paracoccaceae bacterium]
MSISPPSDILLDSLRGVDQVARNASIEKLKKYGQTVITPANGEPSFKSQLVQTQSTGMPFHARSALTGLRNDATLHQTRANPARSALQQFEGAFIKNFIDTMQPSKTSSLYGKGTAGSVWQSFMSDAVSQKISEAGGVGIAKSLESRFNVDAPQTTPASQAPSLQFVTPEPLETAPAESDVGIFSGIRGFFSTIHNLFSSMLPASSLAARRNEFSLTLR